MKKLKQMRKKSKRQTIKYPAIIVVLALIIGLIPCFSYNQAVKANDMDNDAIVLETQEDISGVSNVLDLDDDKGSVLLSPEEVTTEYSEKITEAYLEEKNIEKQELFSNEETTDGETTSATETEETTDGETKSETVTETEETAENIIENKTDASDLKTEEKTEEQNSELEKSDKKIKTQTDGDPKITAYVSTTRGRATADEPAVTSVRPYIYGGWADYSYVVTIDYQNLKPGKKYKIKIYEWDEYGNGSSVTYGTLFTVNDTGNGSWTHDASTFLMSWNTTYTIKLNLKLELLPEEEGDETYTYEPPAGDNSMTVKLIGIDKLKLLIDDDPESEIKSPQFTEVRDAIPVSHRVSVRDLKPNTVYTVTSSLRKLIGEEGGYGYFVANTGLTGTGSFTTDENGYGECTISLGELSEAKEKDIYVGFATVKGDGETYYHSYQQASYLPYAETQDNLLIIRSQQEKEPERETLVDVAIMNYVKGTQTPLPGAKMKLIKGTDVENGEVISEWTSGKEPEKFSLPLGEYTLVQTTPPNDYLPAEPKVFRLEEDDANIRGYHYVGYTKIEETESGLRYDIFKVQKAENPTTEESAYCVNYGKNNPSLIDYYGTYDDIYYHEYDYAEEIAMQQFSNPRLSGEELQQMLSSIMYAGFPNDAAGIMAAYGLTEKEFKAVTQDAIHYYTDGRDFTVESMDNNANMYAAFEKLISGDTKAPEGMTLKLYVPDNENYQALLSTNFRYANIVIEEFLENEKEEVSTEETEESSEETEEEDTTTEEEIIPDKETHNKDLKPEEEDITPKDTKKDKGTNTAKKATKLNKTKAPKTGDDNNIAVYVLLGIFSALTMYVIKKKGIQSK